MSTPAPDAAPPPPPAPAAPTSTTTAATAGSDADDGLRAPRRSPLSSFFFMTFLFFMINNGGGGGDDGALRLRYAGALRSLEWQYGNFTAWVNGTASPNFTMPVVPDAERALVHRLVPEGAELDPAAQAYFPNVTGFIRGPAAAYNISPAAPAPADPLPAWAPDAAALMAGANLTLLEERLGTWNWSAVSRVALSALEKAREDGEEDGEGEGASGEEGIWHVQGHVELTDANTDAELRLDLAGVHFARTGALYALAQPPGARIDLREVPALVPAPDRNATARALLPALRARMRRLRELLAAPDLLSLDAGGGDADEPPATSCAFHVYAQLAPVNVSRAEMDELEEELREPSGARGAVGRPGMLVDVLLLSAECGVMLRVERAEGLRSLLFFRKVTTYAGFSGLIYLALLLLLSREMARCRTPAALARISRWTFLAQIVADSIAFAGHITFAILADGRPSLSLVAPAFLSCALFVYEVQFAMLIQQVQAPEDARPPPAPPAPAPAPTPAAPTDEQGTAPTDPLLPNAQPAPRPPAVQPPAPTRFAALRTLFHAIRADPQARTWLLISVLLFASMRLLLSPSLALLVFGALHFSIWAPQIYRAARRGRACALSMPYMLGTTAGRAALGLYFFGCPRNVLDVQPRAWMAPLAGLMFAQVALVAAQQALGPAFFLPGRGEAAGAAYDYHPPLPARGDAEAARAPLGDCAICMDAIAPEDAADGESKEGALDLARFGGRGRRRAYALAPCHHLFHTACLERWLAIKNICPQCRRPLPPL